MASQDNLHIVKKLYGCINRDSQNQLNAFDDCFTSNARFHDPLVKALCHGKSTIQALKQAENEYIKAFPDKHTKIDAIFTADDNVCVRWTATATQKGPFQGFAASNKTITVCGISVFHIKNGKIDEAWQFWDRATLLEQIGAQMKAAA